MVTIGPGRPQGCAVPPICCANRLPHAPHCGRVRGPVTPTPPDRPAIPSSIEQTEIQHGRPNPTHQGMARGSRSDHNRDRDQQRPIPPRHPQAAPHAQAALGGVTLVGKQLRPAVCRRIFPNPATSKTWACRSVSTPALPPARSRAASMFPPASSSRDCRGEKRFAVVVGTCLSGVRSLRSLRCNQRNRRVRSVRCLGGASSRDCTGDCCSSSCSVDRRNGKRGETL